MSVPIHNLYDYIYQVLENRFIVYYFYPFGHKKLDNLVLHFPHAQDKSHTKILLEQIEPQWQPDIEHSKVYKIFPKTICNLGMIMQYAPTIMCHDQEPLDFEYYENTLNYKDFIDQAYGSQKYFFQQHVSNLRWIRGENMCLQKYVLLHSELNSQEIEKYEDSGRFECAYFWSHAFLALDWYRFANVDKFLQPGEYAKKTFLIYCRDTTGKRTYRKNFLQLLQNSKVNDYQLGSFTTDEITSNTSAEYNHSDFNQSSISVVLETCFDNRIHLTEKLLRCLACGHPFILASGPGSLSYLRSYGFKTFHPYINEDYDLETNNNKRLQMIVDAMENFDQLPAHTKKDYLDKMYSVAQHNKRVFFSEKFASGLVNELVINVNNAQKRTGNRYDVNFIWQYLKYEKQNNKIAYRKNPKRPYVVSFLKHLRKGGTLENYVPPWEK